MRKPPLQEVIVKPVRRDRDDAPRSVSMRPMGRREEMSDIRTAPRTPTAARVARPEPVQPQGAEEFPAYEGSHQYDAPPIRPRDRGLSIEGGDDHRFKWLMVALGVSGIVVLSSIVLSLLFAGATVTVHPLQDRVAVDVSFTATNAPEGAGIAYERITIERTAQRSVVAMGESELEERASGRITVYNETGESVRLIRNTRFESTAGRTYRVREAIEVPPKRADGSPGTIETTIWAEEPGEEYNMGPDTFSIPGLDNTPQKGLLYGRSTGDISGGFVGIQRAVGEEDRRMAMEQLEAQLRDELLSAGFSEVDRPEGKRLFREAVFFEFNTLPDELVEDDKVTVSLSGKLHGLLFDEDVFARQVASLALPSYTGIGIYIKNIEDLRLRVQAEQANNGGESESVPLWQADEYRVTVQGTAHFIWRFDAEAFARDLAGRETSILEMPVARGILEAYPGIDRATAKVRPFWKRTFPDTPEDIVVLTVLDA